MPLKKDDCMSLKIRPLTNKAGVKECKQEETMSEATLSRLWGLSGLRGMSEEDMTSVIKQTLSKPECPDKIVFLDIGEIYDMRDLQNEHARILLYQKINAN